PAPRGATSRWMTASSTSGRAASWTTTTSASSGTSARAAATDSARVGPPVTHATTLDAASSSARRIDGSSHPGGAATTIASMSAQRSRRSMLSARRGRPPRTANAFGRSSPSRSPEPAAAINAHVAPASPEPGGPSGTRGCGLRLRSCLRLRLPGAREDVVEPGRSLFLVHVLRVHELRGEDLLRLDEHLLLAGREALLVVAYGQVSDDLGELQGVAGLHLVAC